MKRRGKTRSRILYWFRTPPGIRVGREPFDPQTVRMLETAHPELAFDWPQLLKGQQGSEPAPPAEARPRAARKENRQGPERARRPQPRPDETAPATPPPANGGNGTSAAAARLGPEGADRLRTRYRGLVARIADQEPDPDRRAELSRQAERLNPDAWDTEDAVSAALDDYERTFESLRVQLDGGARRPSPGSGGEGSTDTEAPPV